MVAMKIRPQFYKVAKNDISTQSVPKFCRTFYSEYLAHIYVNSVII